jgi:ribonuclease Z
MRLTVLGSGDAFSGCGCNAAALIDSAVLVDCGAPVHVQSLRAGADIHGIDLVLLTHFHADHTFMLPVLLGARAFTAAGSPRPLVIAGPVGTREYVRRLVATGYGTDLLDLVDREVSPTYVVLQDGSDVELCGYRVRSHAVVHSVGPSLAYAVSRDGVSLGITGDTALCAGLRRLLGSVDAVLCECSGWDSPVPGGHLWREEVTGLIADYPATRFVLFHMPQRGPVPGAVIAHDLLTLELEAT